MSFGNASDTGHDLPRGAVTTLKCVSLDERRLKRMKSISVSQSFDGNDVAAFNKGSKQQA